MPPRSVGEQARYLNVQFLEPPRVRFWRVSDAKPLQSAGKITDGIVHL